jgi:Icc-related predicted phosphoesterase
VKIVAISDTHGRHRRLTVPQGDVLVHAGDITPSGEVDVVHDFASWLAELPHRHKLVIPGNHDHCFDISKGKFNPGCRQVIEERAHFLLDSAVTIDGLRFYGSPWCPNLNGWAFWDRERDRFLDAPTDIDVLITHGPPAGIHDGGPLSFHSGSAHLARYVRRCWKLQLHIFGHVHEGYGESRLGEVHFVNAASCDRDYQPVNAPIVVDL